MCARASIFAIALMSCVSLSAHARVAAEAVPKDARATIRDVLGAARQRNVQVLRTFMAPGFKWNFGPDGDSADAATRAWQADPDYLRQLVRVLRTGCFLESRDIVTCPGKGGTNFRAGFERTSDGWKLTYFLAGD
jgi:hypothetical protein